MKLTRSEILERVDELQQRYVAALDGKRMNDWLGTFSESPEASYVCTTAENVESDLPLALIMDDCRARLEDRVTFVTEVWAGTYTDYKTRHFVQRTACRVTGDSLVDVESNFLIVWVPGDTSTPEVFSNGVYQDQIRLTADGAEFMSKKVITDAPAVQRYVVFPF